MKKIKLRKKVNPITGLIILVILVVIGGFILLHYFSKRVTPVVFRYAEIETKKFSNMIINEAIATNITKKATPEEIFSITRNNLGEIESVDFNTITINKYLSDTTSSIQNNLKNIENGNIEAVEYSAKLIKKYKKTNLKKGIIFYISSGLAFKNPILANLGPKIPVKISLVGDIISNISAEVSDYGINNSMIKVYVNLKITEQIILPFYGKNIVMDAKIPIAIKIINGKIPDYYSGTNKNTDPFVISTN